MDLVLFHKVAGGAKGKNLYTGGICGSSLEQSGLLHGETSNHVDNATSVRFRGRRLGTSQHSCTGGGQTE